MEITQASSSESIVNLRSLESFHLFLLACEKQFSAAVPPSPSEGWRSGAWEGTRPPPGEPPGGLSARCWAALLSALRRNHRSPLRNGLWDPLRAAAWESKIETCLIPAEVEWSCPWSRGGGGRSISRLCIVLPQKGEIGCGGICSLAGQVRRGLMSRDTPLENIWHFESCLLASIFYVPGYPDEFLAPLPPPLFFSWKAEALFFFQDWITVSWDWAREGKLAMEESLRV